MRRAIANIITIILAFVLQTAVFPFVPYFQVAPNLLLLLTFSLAFVYGETEGILYGVFCGVLMDMFYAGPLGVYTLIFGIIGFLNGLFSKYYYDNYIFIPVALSAVNGFIYNLYLFVYKFLTQRNTDFMFFLRKIILPEIVITLIFTLIFYRLILAFNSALGKIDEKEKKKRVNEGLHRLFNRD